MPSSNPELELAHDFVTQTNRHLFLTGKAGTGKTTFLHALKERTPKRMIVTAPTGVAAINAGGVTLHSFFQLPFGPFVPGGEYYQRDRAHRFSREKRDIITTLDLLVIDEISMVRADLLDGVDAVLRRFRRSDEPFGGVQLLMIGDLGQLSPIAKPDEWEILRRHYDTLYFFGSKALRQSDMVAIELRHIYRQSDGRFIDLLNRVRDNRLDQDALARLNSRHRPGFEPPESEGWIILSTHNHKVDTINTARLAALDKKVHRFQARTEGEFPEYSYPAPGTLELKAGAQVMFVRNDPSADKLYYNGKIGKVARIDGNRVLVRCPGDRDDIEVAPSTWENLKYTLDEETKEIRENKVGAFIQYPLKLAWAITIHKSQGLTFERAVIDAGQAFAHGQVYVALSRCKTFEGLVLSSPIVPQSIKTDPEVLQFVREADARQPDRAALREAGIDFQQGLLRDCFDFEGLGFSLRRLIGLLRGNARIVHVVGVDDPAALASRAAAEILQVGENFGRELTRLFAARALPEEDALVLERIVKASGYFQARIEDCLAPLARDLRVESDNREVGKKIGEARDQFQRELAVKLGGIRACEQGFSPADYLRARARAEVDFTPARTAKAPLPDYIASDVEHPELFEALRQWRTDQASEEGDLPHHRIMHQRVLIQIAVLLPDDLGALLKIKGIGKATVKKYGQDLVKIVRDYRKRHDIREPSPPKIKNEQGAEEKIKEEKSPQKHSREISLEMFRQGMDLARIAEERGFARSTINGHLSHFVESGELPIGDLLSREKQAAIEQGLDAMPDSPLGEVKALLGEDYSYGEIRLVQAHRRFGEQANGTDRAPGEC